MIIFFYFYAFLGNHFTVHTHLLFRVPAYVWGVYLAHIYSEFMGTSNP